MRELLAAEAVDEAAAADQAAGLKAAERPQDLAPGHRDVLPDEQVTEHHTPARGQLLGDRLRQLVRVAAGRRGRQQRPPAAGPRGWLAGPAQPAPRLREAGA